MNTSLVPSANEFVPGNYSANVNVLQYNDMNTTASEWIPGQTNNNNTIEQMVEINWNGHLYYVPQSMTYESEDGNIIYTGSVESLTEEEGMLWAQGTSTVPAPPKRCLQTIGIPDPIRQHFRTLDLISLRQMEPDDERYKELPLKYISAYRLDEQTATGPNSFGYPSSLTKVIDQTDSQMYALRRFDNVRISYSVINNAINLWRDIRHPNIVTLYNIFVEKGAIFFTYAYYPGAVTIKQKFIDQQGPIVNENILWRIFIQLLSAIRLVHKRRNAIRVIDPAHIILTSGTNFRFSCVGVMDVLEFESRKTINELQQEDIIKLARTILSVAARTNITPSNIEEALLLFKQHYSPELVSIIRIMLTNKITIMQICNQISERIHDELDTSMAASDALCSHLRNEYENSRLFRLLLKLNFINERPDTAYAPQWSETGDRYILKLFRDYIFHQCDNINGYPILDAGHVITALNKVDVGDMEEILLSSRDGKDLLVVTYADVKRCLEQSFDELTQQSLMSSSNNSSNNTEKFQPTLHKAAARAAHYHQFQTQQLKLHQSKIYNQYHDSTTATTNNNNTTQRDYANNNNINNYNPNLRNMSQQYSNQYDNTGYTQSSYNNYGDMPINNNQVNNYQQYYPNNNNNQASYTNNNNNNNYYGSSGYY